DFFRALRGRMERGGFFGDDGSISHQIERIDEFVALESMLAAKTSGIRTFLNFLALKRSGGNAAAGNHLALVNARADAGSEPGIDFAELHVRFGQRDAFYAAHFGVGRKEQGELCFKRDFERVFAERALPTVHVGLLWRKNHFAPFRERSEEHTSELQSRGHLVCRLLLEKKKTRQHSDSFRHQLKMFCASSTSLDPRAISRDAS